MTLSEKIVSYIKNILSKFTKTTESNFTITETLNRLDTITKNQVWYRGEPFEIQQMYEQAYDYFGGESFWNVAPSSHKISMKHYPLPQVIVDTLTSVCSNDIQDVQITNDQQLNELLEKILKDSNKQEFFEENIKEQLISGDCGVFPHFYKNGKITWEIVLSENCDYSETEDEWYVKQIYKKNNKNYVLITTFGKGYIKYNLFNERGVEVPLSEIEKLKDLQDVIFKKDGKIDEDLCLFVLFKTFCSPKFRGRGKCIYENRDSAFDFVDEAYSIWAAADRKSTPKAIMNKAMLKKDKFGATEEFNDYDLDIVKVGAEQMMNGDNLFEVYNPSFPSNDYYQTLNMAIQSALVQIISPTTAGIDMRVYQNNVNTSYSQEIEKITIQTHNKILYNFSDSLKKLILATFKGYAYLSNTDINFDELEDNIVVNFNDFSSPSDDKIIPLFCQAITSGLMSREEAIREWHVDWNDTQIEEELKRINNDKSEDYISDAELFNVGSQQINDDLDIGEESE